MPCTANSLSLPQNVRTSPRGPCAPQCGEVLRSRVEVEQRTSVQAFTERRHVSVDLQVCDGIAWRDEVRVAEDLEGEGRVGNMPIQFGVYGWEGPVACDISRTIRGWTDWRWKLSECWSHCGDAAEFCNGDWRIAGIQRGYWWVLGVGTYIVSVRGRRTGKD